MTQRTPPDELQAPFSRLLHETAITAPLAALEMCSFLHEMLHDLRALAVSQARLSGSSWAAIAAALDMAPETVRRRFGPIVPA